jgi:hypothetical protein
MSHRYRYTGKEELHLPEHNLVVKHGQTVEVEDAIKHPDFDVVHEKQETKAKEEPKTDK